MNDSRGMLTLAYSRIQALPVFCWASSSFGHVALDDHAQRVATIVSDALRLAKNDGEVVRWHIDDAIEHEAK